MTGFNNLLLPPGLHDAEIFSVDDLGVLPSKFGPKRRLEVVFRVENDVLGAYRAERRYHYTLGDGSHLLRDVASLLGRRPDENFDPKSLVGMRCQIHSALKKRVLNESKVLILGLVPARRCVFPAKIECALKKLEKALEHSESSQ